MYRSLGFLRYEVGAFAIRIQSQVALFVEPLEMIFGFA